MTFETVCPQLVGLISCAVILWRAEPALNRMSRCSPRLLRLAFVLLTVGAVAGIFYILIGVVPSWPTLLLAVGTALLLFCERRVRILTARSHLNRKGIPHA